MTIDPKNVDKAWPYKEEFDENDIQHWLLMFQKVNRDCSRDGEAVVPFSDKEFYADQIYILTGEKNMEKAKVLAIGLANL